MLIDRIDLLIIELSQFDVVLNNITGFWHWAVFSVLVFLYFLNNVIKVPISNLVKIFRKFIWASEWNLKFIVISLQKNDVAIRSITILLLIIAIFHFNWSYTTTIRRMNKKFDYLYFDSFFDEIIFMIYELKIFFRNFFVRNLSSESSNFLLDSFTKYTDLECI